jgi:hypothetical protein
MIFCSSPIAGTLGAYADATGVYADAKASIAYSAGFYYRLWLPSPRHQALSPAILSPIAAPSGAIAKAAGFYRRLGNINAPVSEECTQS